MTHSTNVFYLCVISILQQELWLNTFTIFKIQYSISFKNTNYTTTTLESIQLDLKPMIPKDDLKALDVVGLTVLIPWLDIDEFAPVLHINARAS